MVENLGQVHFTSYDGYMLMEAVWARDASKWATSNTTDELLAARRLFDWTVRNIANDYDKPDRPPQVPWETLFLGHGLPWERAWTYVLLLRQRGIDAAVLAVPGAESAPESLRPWCVGVLIGEKEKKLYLFDLQLGLPIPAPGGIVADKSGQLDVQPATLEQVKEDPKLLERLAQGTDKPYWVKADDLKGVVALSSRRPCIFQRGPGGSSCGLRASRSWFSMRSPPSRLPASRLRAWRKWKSGSCPIGRSSAAWP